MALCELDSDCDGVLTELELLRFMKIMSRDPEAKELSEELKSFVGKTPDEIKLLLMVICTSDGVLTDLYMYGGNQGNVHFRWCPD